MFTGTRLTEGEYTSGRIYITNKKSYRNPAQPAGIFSSCLNQSAIDKLKELYLEKMTSRLFRKSLETMDWLEFAGFPHNPLNKESKQMLGQDGEKEYKKVIREGCKWQG